MIGYTQPSGSLNYVAECLSPEDSVLREGFDVLVPGAHLHMLNPVRPPVLIHLSSIPVI